MLRRRRIPDLTGEQAVPYRIKSLDGTHTNRKSPSDEWVVLGRPVRRHFFGILFRMLNILVSHQDSPPDRCFSPGYFRPAPVLNLVSGPGSRLAHQTTSHANLRSYGGSLWSRRSDL